VRRSRSDISDTHSDGLVGALVSGDADWAMTREYEEEESAPEMA
jgi:hypothetical protein